MTLTEKGCWNRRFLPLSNRTSVILARLRAFRLGTEIDQAAANAKYVDGVLKLTLPKKAAAAGRQLTIQ